MTQITDTAIWDIATEVLTDKQLEICRMIYQRNLSIRQTAEMLDLHPSTVTSQRQAALRRIAAHLARKDAA